MDLRNEISKLPYIEKTDKWSEHRRALVNHVLTENIGDFINWSTIQATMFTGDTDAIGSMYAGIECQNKPTRYKIAMRENWLGNPPKSKYNDFASANLIRMAFYAMQIEKRLLMDIQDFNSIFEFGGGYGAFAYVARNLWFTGEYYLYDFPEYLLLQQYYLETNGIQANYEHELGQYNVDLFLAISSLSESPVEIREKIFDRVNFNYCFIEFQPVWDGINNTEYFTNFAKTNLSKWKILSSNIDNHMYLIGQKHE